MIGIVFCIGLFLGYLLDLAVSGISYDLYKSKRSSVNFIIIFISGIVLLILFLEFGLTITFVKGAVMAVLLIIVSFVDLKHEIIPDKLWIMTAIGGTIFAFLGELSLVSSLLGMFTGGLILLFLAAIPHTLGGGDIKLMFGLGAFLGPYKTFAAIFLAFALSAVISIFLLVFKIKGRKDYIPFGPFLALGSFISFLM